MLLRFISWHNYSLMQGTHTLAPDVHCIGFLVGLVESNEEQDVRVWKYHKKPSTRPSCKVAFQVSEMGAVLPLNLCLRDLFAQKSFLDNFKRPVMLPAVYRDGFEHDRGVAMVEKYRNGSMNSVSNFSAINDRIHRAVAILLDPGGASVGITRRALQIARKISDLIYQCINVPLARVLTEKPFKTGLFQGKNRVYT